MSPLTIFAVFCASVSSTYAAQCACATGNVHVRDGAGVSHTILGTMSPGQCVPYKGNEVHVGSMPWAHVDYNGHDGYVAANWLNIQACSGSGSHTTHTSTQQLPGCPRIISRAEWGARAPTRAAHNLPHTPKYVYIHHGASAACFDEDACKHIIRSYQNYHMDSHGWFDIGYTFVIGEDGNVYESQGWGKIGVHTLNHNSDGLGFCVIGNFEKHPPNAKAIAAVKQLIQCGVSNGQIQTNYVVKGHRDVRATACPGQKFYDLIQTWPHYNKNG